MGTVPRILSHDFVCGVATSAPLPFLQREEKGWEWRPSSHLIKLGYKATYVVFPWAHGGAGSTKHLGRT